MQERTHQAMCPNLSRTSTMGTNLPIHPMDPNVRARASHLQIRAGVLPCAPALPKKSQQRFEKEIIDFFFSEGWKQNFLKDWRIIPMMNFADVVIVLFAFIPFATCSPCISRIAFS